MKLISIALRHPISVLIVIAAIAMAFAAAVGKPVVEQLGYQVPRSVAQGRHDSEVARSRIRKNSAGEDALRNSHEFRYERTVFDRLRGG